MTAKAPIDRAPAPNARARQIIRARHERDKKRRQAQRRLVSVSRHKCTATARSSSASRMSLRPRSTRPTRRLAPTPSSFSRSVSLGNYRARHLHLARAATRAWLRRLRSVARSSASTRRPARSRPHPSESSASAMRLVRERRNMIALTPRAEARDGSVGQLAAGGRQAGRRQRSQPRSASPPRSTPPSTRLARERARSRASIRSARASVLTVRLDRSKRLGLGCGRAMTMWFDRAAGGRRSCWRLRRRPAGPSVVFGRSFDRAAPARAGDRRAPAQGARAVFTARCPVCGERGRCTTTSKRTTASP